MAWSPMRLDEGHILKVGNRDCLCWALTLWLLDHVEVVFGTVRGSVGLGKDLEEMAVYQATWFPPHTEVFQCINNQYRHTSAYWVSALSVEKLVMTTLLPSAMRIMWHVLCYDSISAWLHAGWEVRWLVQGRDWVPFIWDQLLLIMRPPWDSDLTLLCFALLSSKVRCLLGSNSLNYAGPLQTQKPMVQSWGSTTFRGHSSPCMLASIEGHWRGPKYPVHDYAY